MYQLVLILHVFVSILLIALVLMQHGKGADIGASFGSGASTTVFGSQGTGGVLFKATSILAIVFFITSLTLSYLVSVKHIKNQTISLPIDSNANDGTIQIPKEIP